MPACHTSFPSSGRPSDGSATSTSRSVVVDAGGVLVFAGTLDGRTPADVAVLALDGTAMTLGRFIAARFEGNAAGIRVEFGIALAAVDEWFPVRSLVADTLERAGLDSWSAILLAEQFDLPLLTASDEVSSQQIEIYRRW